mgnify:CR=1 FL=1|tara:strand:- start:215 stop:850 length:636 start_codon:yes stop_codon:yes gene_type:complete
MFNIDKYREIEEFIKIKEKNTKIIAISKNHSVDKVRAAIANGVRVFGENRVQEAMSKFVSIKQSNPSIELHLTGPLQTNKVKQALDIFDVFHTLDREKILKEFSKFQSKIDQKSFFIQVNTGKELSKSGIYPEEVKKYLTLCEGYGIKNIIGLMCIPPIDQSPKKHFEMINKLSKDHGLKGLSIGMSSDYLDALEFNPTYIRLGTTLFGIR